MVNFEQERARVLVKLAQFRNALVERHPFGPAIICTTGSRQGPTTAQDLTFTLARSSMSGAILHDGAAIGWDRKAAYLWQGPVEFWPSNDEQERWAKEKFGRGEGNYIHAIRDPLQRNRCMVNASNGVIAAPMSSAEIMRSGTWATIRYARKAGKPVLVIWPNGEIVFDGSFRAGPEKGPDEP